jgi:hypothetical protein
VQTYEKYPVRGFQSSMEIPLHVGLGQVAVDSIFLVWPDNSYQSVNGKRGRVLLQYQLGLPQFNYAVLAARWPNPTHRIADVTQRSGLYYKHEENPFVEFDREPLIPFMVSKEGPGLAVGDATGDGLDDVFIGSSKSKKERVFFQNANGQFSKVHAARPGKRQHL